MADSGSLEMRYENTAEHLFFALRTFVVQTQQDETVARVRAQLLHVLYELGKENHQFRLRFKGQYLRDAFFVEDYGIYENAILKMIPLSSRPEADDQRSLYSASPSLNSTESGPGIFPAIKNALVEEVSAFVRRENIIFHFKSLLYIHFMAIWFCALTVYWYASFWVAVLFFGGTLYCPTFTRQSGFIGRHSLYRNQFCVIFGLYSLASVGAALYFCSSAWIVVLRHGCKDYVFEGDCSTQQVFTGMFHGVHSLCLLASFLLSWALFHNIKLEYGDIVEKYLVQSRDIEEVMKSASQGRTKEKRMAAFELATMAASGDDNKFRIVAEGGLEMLIRLALSKDESTQEHSVEAIAELLTVPAIQDNFIEIGGVRSLSALLHSPSARVVYQCATAISYIVSDTEENKSSIVADHGMDDLAHAALIPNTLCQRIIAGIFLELAFTPEIRHQMASFNFTPVKALTELCASSDPECQRLALQTLELLAIESPETICAQKELLIQLLKIPDLTFDTRSFILAAKILLYYAEDRESCEDLLDQPNCKSTLTRFARTKDPILQKVVVKVIYCMLHIRELRYRAEHMKMKELLSYIRENAADRETWDMADQALQFLSSEPDGLQHLQQLSTLEKIDRMESVAQGPLSSRISLRSSLADSISDLKKGLE